jgi:hypothetical protein
MRHINTFDPAWVRRNLVLTLVASIVVANAFIIFPDEESSRPFFSNWTINAAAAVALGMSLIVTWRQKLDGLHGRTYAAFAAGLDVVKTMVEVWPANSAAAIETMIITYGLTTCPKNLRWQSGGRQTGRIQRSRTRLQATETGLSLRPARNTSTIPRRRIRVQALPRSRNSPQR